MIHRYVKYTYHNHKPAFLTLQYLAPVNAPSHPLTQITEDSL